jgi:heme-degrading monooxygenase HmoA
VQARFEQRAARYMDVPGLIQKHYLRFRDTGEFGAVCVWASEDALTTFKQSQLARTISGAYQVDEGPLSELADVRLVVQPSAAVVSH